MTNQELETFLNIIDSRIKKYINENKILKQYCGEVVKITVQEEGINTSAKVIECEVRLLGYEKLLDLDGEEYGFTFLNKSGEDLFVGDYVYVQTVGSDLNTGVITYKAGK